MSCAHCHLHRPAPLIDIQTLEPLPAEVRNRIFVLYLEDPVDRLCAPHLIDFLLISRRMYQAHAWRLYEIIMINDKNCKTFFNGLYDLRARTKKKEVVDVLHNWSPIPYQTSDYNSERNIPVTLPHIIRKFRLLRHCRCLGFETHTAYLQFVDILDKLYKYVDKHIKGIHDLHDWAECDFFPGMTEVSFGRQFMEQYFETKSTDLTEKADSLNFRPRTRLWESMHVKHVCLFMPEWRADIPMWPNYGFISDPYLAYRFRTAALLEYIGFLGPEGGPEGSSCNLHNAHMEVLKSGWEADEVTFDLAPEELEDLEDRGESHLDEILEYSIFLFSQYLVNERKA